MSTNINELKRKLEEVLAQKCDIERQIQSLNQEIEEAKNPTIEVPVLAYLKDDTYPLKLYSKNSKILYTSLCKIELMYIIGRYIESINDQDPDFKVKDWSDEANVCGLVIIDNEIGVYYLFNHNYFISCSYVYPKAQKHLDPLLKFLTETKALIRGEERPLFHLLF